jgi:hypothetical protein
MECLTSGFSMDQFGITLCDIGLYEKEHLVQRFALHFGAPRESGQNAQGSSRDLRSCRGDDTLVDRERKSKRCGINI